MEALWLIVVIGVFGFLLWRKSQDYEVQKITYKGYDKTNPDVRSPNNQHEGEFVVLGNEVDDVLGD